MPRPTTIEQGGRAKAYRPLSAARRRAALVAGLAAFERGDAFLAHELLEPAWMGTAAVGERELYQGLIKLAASEVHAVRGNPVGVAKNLRGALARLGRADDRFDGGLDLAAIRSVLAERLAALDHGVPGAGRPMADPRLPRHGPGR